MKKCLNCCEYKEYSEFHKHSTSSDGLQTNCKLCRSKKDKEYRIKNKNKIAIVKKLYRENNKEKIKKMQNDYRRGRKLLDPTYKLKNSIRRSINNGFKRSGYPKTSKTHEILGCSFEDLKLHLESKFEDWMTWDNYGKYNGEEGFGWDIDHIIPSSSAINESEVIKLNHFTNLQPLCSYINRDIKKDLL